MGHPGNDTIKLFSASFEAKLKFNPIRNASTGHVTTLIGQNFSVASIYAMLKRQPTREAKTGHVTTLIGQNFCLASIKAEKSFIGLGPS